MSTARKLGVATWKPRTGVRTLNRHPEPKRGDRPIASQTEITPEDFFSDPAAKEVGFTEHFWHRAYTLYLGSANRDPNPSMEKIDLPRTVRMPFM